MVDSSNDTELSGSMSISAIFGEVDLVSGNSLAHQNPLSTSLVDDAQIEIEVDPQIHLRNCSVSLKKLGIYDINMMMTRHYSRPLRRLSITNLMESSDGDEGYHAPRKCLKNVRIEIPNHQTLIKDP